MMQCILPLGKIRVNWITPAATPGKPSAPPPSRYSYQQLPTSEKGDFCPPWLCPTGNVCAVVADTCAGRPRLAPGRGTTLSARATQVWRSRISSRPPPPPARGPVRPLQGSEGPRIGPTAPGRRRSAGRRWPDRRLESSDDERAFVGGQHPPSAAVDVDAASGGLVGKKSMICWGCGQ